MAIVGREISSEPSTLAYLHNNQRDLRFPKTLILVHYAVSGILLWHMSPKPVSGQLRVGREHIRNRWSALRMASLLDDISCEALFRQPRTAFRITHCYPSAGRFSCLVAKPLFANKEE